MILSSHHSEVKFTDACRRTHILADPSSFEEPLLDSTVSIIADENGDLISVNQLGLGLALSSRDVLEYCTLAAKERCKPLCQQLLNIS